MSSNPLAFASSVTAWSNLRDLGGLRTSGGVVKRGVLMRADAPYGGDPQPQLHPWPPQLVIDLRQRSESSLPFTWSSLTTAVVCPLFADAAPTIQTESILDLYQRMLDTAAPQIARTVNLVTSSIGPVLIHCAAGKDRTGVIIAMLLAAIGVQREEIVADYRRTEVALPTIIARLRQSHAGMTAGQVPEQFLKCDPAAIEGVLDRLNSEGGPLEWLARSGVDEERLQAWVRSATE